MEPAVVDPWPAARRVTARALAEGALHPVANDWRYLERDGARFLVRMLDARAVKPRAAGAGSAVGEADAPDRADAALAGTGPGGAFRANPFLPYDRRLHVADVGPDYVCLLNKYYVIEHHLLLVTREFEPQEAPLAERDFEALWRCLPPRDALGFYNSGPRAGASQPHRHLQLVPLPLVPGGDPPVPVEPLLGLPASPGVPAHSPALPFAHRVARLDPALGASPRAAARATAGLYAGMLEALGREPADPGPYNLLLTTRWMLLVARSRSHVEDIEVNALGYAGSFFVRDEAALARLERLGPLGVLAAVGEPAPGRVP